MSGEGYLAKDRCMILGNGPDTAIVAGVHTTVAAADTITTPLREVDSVTVSLGEDASVDVPWVTAAPGTTAGTIVIKTWKPTANDNVTPIAATTFEKKVSFVAVGRF